MPGTVKIKFYDKGLFDGEKIDLSVDTKSELTALYVDKTEKTTTKKEKTVKKEKPARTKKKDTNSSLTKPNKVATIPSGQFLVREETDRKAGIEKTASKTQEKSNIERTTNAHAQIDMFNEIGVEKQNYKFVKKLAMQFFDDATALYDHFASQNNKVVFNKKQMLKSLNEYLQSIFIASELSKGEKANENNLQFALEISWFSNLFDSAKSLTSLSQLAKTKLLEVPEIFMIAVVVDKRENAENCKKLYGGIKKIFLLIYQDNFAEFNLLTKSIVNFLQKQGITP